MIIFINFQGIKELKPYTNLDVLTKCILFSLNPYKSRSQSYKIWLFRFNRVNPAALRSPTPPTTSMSACNQSSTKKSMCPDLFSEETPCGSILVRDNIS